MNIEVLYNQDSTHNFSEYGIEIPLLNQRIEETVNHFKITSRVFSEINSDDLRLAHNKEFIDRVENYPDDLVKETYELVNSDGDYHRYNPNNRTKPLTDFIEKAKIHVAGTYDASKVALQKNIAYHLGGGMHHAMSMKPGGFCMFNDLVIAIRKLQREGLVNKCAVIDLDCHKGDGTAEITQGDDSIKTLSIHMKDGWPLDGDPSGPSFIASDLDIPVQREDAYLEKLEEGLTRFLCENFDLVLVVHGVDVWEKDALPSSEGVLLNKQEVLKRDLLVYNSLKEKSIPQAWCLGGGYGAGVSQLYIQFLEKIL